MTLWYTDDVNEFSIIINHELQRSDTDNINIQHLISINLSRQSSPEPLWTSWRIKHFNHFIFEDTVSFKPMKIPVWLEKNCNRMQLNLKHSSRAISKSTRSQCQCWCSVCFLSGSVSSVGEPELKIQALSVAGWSSDTEQWAWVLNRKQHFAIYTLSLTCLNPDFACCTAFILCCLFFFMKRKLLLQTIPFLGLSCNFKDKTPRTVTMKTAVLIKSTPPHPLPTSPAHPGESELAAAQVDQS